MRDTEINKKIPSNSINRELNYYHAEQARRWLEGIRSEKRKAELMRDLVEEARENAAGIRGIDYTADHVSGSGSHDTMTSAVISIDRLIKQYAEQMEAAADLQSDGQRRLALIQDDSERELLTRRYLLEWTWKNIRERMHYSHQGVMSLHRRALISAWYVMPVSERDQIQQAL